MIESINNLVEHMKILLALNARLSKTFWADKYAFYATIIPGELNEEFLSVIIIILNLDSENFAPRTRLIQEILI